MLRRLSLLSAVVVLAAPVALTAQVVTFEELPTAAYASLSNPYMGFNWFYDDGTAQQGALEYTSNSETGVNCHDYVGNCVYNAWGSSAIEINNGAGTPFHLSGWINNYGFPGFGAGARRVRVTEYLSGNTAAFHTVDFVWDGEEHFDLDGTYNTLIFTPLDYDSNPLVYAPGQGSDGYIVLDDLTFTSAAVTTPEPGTLVMLGTGLVGMVGFRRRKRA